MRVVVIGGTGLLNGAAVALADRGWRVVLPGRRADRVTDRAQSAHRVRADRASPDGGLTDRIRTASGGSADLMVVWAHGGPYGPMAETVAPLPAEDAPVVEVHSGSSAHTGGLLGHPTHQVVLGVVDHAGRTRRPTPAEVTAAVVTTVDRATAGRLPGVHQLGLPRALAS